MTNPFTEIPMEKDFNYLTRTEIECLYDELLDSDGDIFIDGHKFFPCFILRQLDPDAYREGYETFKLDNWDDLMELDDQERIKMEGEDE